MDSALLAKLAHGSGKVKPKHLKEFHAKELHDGKYHVRRHSGKPGEEPVEHVANDISEVHSALEDHMGQPNDGEAESEQENLGKGQPGMGGEDASY